MKRLSLVCFLAITVSFLNAQKIYFLYFQTETAEPFFIRMNDDLYSSTASGYLILPKLKDSTYNFKLGFPGKTVDLDFSTTIRKKDHGYLIKNFGEKGWGLFDLQSLSIQMPTSASKGTTQALNNSPAQVNAFTDLLSKAADDPSLRQNLILVKQEEKKPQAVEAVVKEEKKPEATDAVIREEKKSDPTVSTTVKAEENKPAAVNTSVPKSDSVEKISGAITQEVYKRSQVTKISATSTTEGLESVFVDQHGNGSNDTIRILIPAEREIAIAKEEAKPDSISDNRKFLEISADTTQVINKSQQENKKEEAKKWWPFGKSKDAETNKHPTEVKKETVRTPLFKKNKNETANQPKPAEEKSGQSKKWNLFNKKKAEETEAKRCRVVAGNDDFLKLRRKMAAKTNDDGMIEEAKKYFREKCFSTEQIKNLSSMFLSNAGKFNFFETAHDYVSDVENFSSLQTELKDDKYSSRFRTTFGN